MHTKAQAGDKCSRRQPIHLLVLGVTALCFGALVKYAGAFSLAGLEFVTRLLRGEQREARWRA